MQKSNTSKSCCLAEPMQINKRNKEINKKKIIQTECNQTFTPEELAELEKPF